MNNAETGKKQARKRKRCGECGQFVAPNHVCAISIASREIYDNQTFANKIIDNQSLGVLYVIADEAICVGSVAENHIRRKCQNLVLQGYLKSKPITEAADVKLSSVKPNRIEPICGDGDCLFTSMGVSIGMSHGSGSSIRKLIVEHMKIMNWPNNTLNTSVYSMEFPNRSRVVNCNSVNEYLAKSNMETDGIYGGCVEIYAFCELFELDVYVYHALWSLWLIYPFASNTERRGVFLQQTLNVNHFEVVRDVCEVPVTKEQTQPMNKRHEQFQCSTDEKLEWILQEPKDCQNPNTVAIKSVANKPPELITTGSITRKRCSIQQDNLLNSQSDEQEPIPKNDSKKFKKNEIDMKRSIQTVVQEKTVQNVAMANSGEPFKRNRCNEEQLPQKLELLTPLKVTDEEIMKLTKDLQAVGIKNTLPTDHKRERETAEGDICDKCKRQPIIGYPLKLTKVASKCLFRRKFGARLLSEEVYLCEVCFAYCSAGNVTWEKAWPSVFFTLLSNSSLTQYEHGNICALLPWSFRQQWMKSIGSFPLPVQCLLNRLRPNGKLTVDGTLRLHSFNNLINSLKQKDLAEALDEEPYPNVRCPFGCWCFIEDKGFIPMHHFLNMFVEEFVSFNSCWQSNLRGIRQDFLIPTVALNKFIVAATVRVDEKAGLVMQTCTEHSKGSSLQYIHAPVHPKLHRMCPRFQERLTVASPTLSGISNVKANYASHTYQLIKSTGSFSGMSTVQLRHNTRWDITSDLLYHAEGNAHAYRRDVQMLVRKWVREGKLIEDIAESLECYSPNRIITQDCLLTATETDLNSCMKLSNLLNKLDHEILLDEDVLRCYSFAHPNDDHGSPPPVLNGSTSIELWFLQCATCLSPQLCEMIVETNKFPELRKRLMKFLRTTFFKSFRKNQQIHQRHMSYNELQRCIEEVINEDKQSINSYYRCLELISKVCNKIQCIDLAKRVDLKTIRDQISSQNDYLAITTKGDNNLRNKMKPPSVINVGSEKFELVLLGHDLDSEKELTVFIRHGGKYCKFWKLKKGMRKAVPINEKADSVIESFGRGYWNILLYRKERTVELLDLKWEFFSNMTGQGIFICEDHDLPLTKDFPGSGYLCRCGKKSFLRCGISECSSCVCKNHFQQGLQNPNIRVSIGPTVVQVDHGNNSDVNQRVTNAVDSATNTECESLVTASATSDESFCNVFNGLQSEKSSINESVPLLTAVPSQELLTIDLSPAANELPAVPLHILLNAQCSLLHRKEGKLIHVTCKQKRFLENIAATTAYSLPLIQPEAMLFPTLFWYQNENGSYNGAIPSALFESKKHNQQLGFEGIENLLLTRIKDGSLLQSCSAPYLQFVFDTLLNIQLKSMDVRVVLNRGWQELGHGQCNSKYVGEHNFKFDCADSRKNVSELAALIRDVKPTYFFTYTCGASTHPGLRKIFSAIEEFCPPESNTKEMRLTVIQAEMMPMLRAWYRASQYVMKWIKDSPEQPLGPVSHFWMRYEWQEETGAFPHIHALIFTSENKFSYTVQSRICCSKETFLGGVNTFCKWISPEDCLFLGELFMKYQSHNCKKAKNRCQKETERHKEPVCRVPQYPASQQFSFKEIPVNFSNETMNLLEEINLAEVDDRTCLRTVKDPLKAGKHHYPTNYGEHMSPTNAQIFALTQSSTNVQICDDYMSARYVAKYAAGMESRANAKIVAGKTSNSVQVETEKIQNEKIAGVQSKRQKNVDKPNSVNGRIVSITECLWWSLKLPYVCSNVDFIHVPTVPKEFRAGVVIEKSKVKMSNLGNTFLDCVQYRKEVLKLPKHRLFTKTQTLILEDVQISSISPDKVTVFGLRPPELLFVRKVKEYYSWFVRRKTVQKQSKSNHCLFVKNILSDSYWVDGLNYVVKLRPSAINKFIKLCKTRGDSVRDEVMKSETRKMILPKIENKSLWSSLVESTPNVSSVDAVVVFSHCLANNPTKFLLHSILTFGNYDTELDILNVKNLKESFLRAELIDSETVSASEVQQLSRAYLLEQLRFIPGSSKMIDKFLLMAHTVMLEALTANNLYFPSAVPAVLDKSISEEYEEAFVIDLTVEKCKTVEFLQRTQSNLPPENVMIDATPESPVDWNPQIKRSADQSAESFGEQKKLLNKLVKCIEMYKSGNCCFIKHQIVIGPPGTGKTFVMLKALAFAICQGLVCIVTSLAAERAAALAGKHLNALIPFPVEKNASAESMSKHALTTLQRNPNKTKYLRALDLLFIEEVSMISSELWAATDEVLQTISSNFVPFGGKLVIATGDFFQLPPPSGTYLIRSSYPITTFDFNPLKQFVRMQNKLGQELLLLMSTVTKSAASAKRVWEIIEQTCTFVDMWHEVANDAIRVFATRKAEWKATAEKINEVKKNGILYSEVEATDEMCVSSTDTWIAASSNAVKFLNKKCLEPQCLFLYLGAMLRLTVNKPTVKAYQGQLCVLVSMEHLAENGSITVALAPPGCRIVPDVTVVRTTWRCVTLTKELGIPHRWNFRTVCRRIQLPVKLFVASTIHKTMGETLPNVATQIVGAKEFSLWLLEQLYVVVSRVRNLSNVTFVGSKENNEQSVLLLMNKKSQWSELTTEIINKCTSDNGKIFFGKTSPFPMLPTLLPTDNLGYCYILRSVPMNRLLYIGSTMCLGRRLREHNAGLGSTFTKVPWRRPWEVGAFVAGFHLPTASIRIREFEKQWMREVAEILNTRKRNVSFLEAIECGQVVMKKWLFNDDNLKMVVC